MQSFFTRQWVGRMACLLGVVSHAWAQPNVGAGYGGVYNPNSTYVAKPSTTPPSGFPFRGFLSNGTTRIGVNTQVGSVIDWASWDNNNNLINAPIWASTGQFDAGRQMQMALYSNPDQIYQEQNQLTTGIGWNSVQGGDIGDNPTFGTTLTYANDNTTLYSKAQGKQWEMRNIPGKAYVESWIRAAPDNPRVWRIHYRATLFRDDAFTSRFPSARQQEFPCIYHEPAYSELLYCQGQPYTNASLTSLMLGQDGMQTPIFSTEPFVFKRNPTTGRVLVLYSPISGRFTPARFLAGPGADPRGSSFSSSYIATTPVLNLDHDGVYDIDVAMGEFATLAEARSWAYTQPRWSGLPEYRFDQNGRTRYGFKLYSCQDQTEKNITTAWNITPIRDGQDRTDFDINLPEQWINGRQVQHLYIKGSFTGTTAMWLRWKKVGSSTEYFKSFTVSGTGVEQLIDLNMTNEPNWAGQDILDCTIKRAQINGSYPPLAANEQWSIKWISYRNQVPDFSLSANAPTINCGASVQLTATCTGNCTGVSYSWSGNGINQTGQSISVTPPNSNGSYTYTVTGSKPTGSTTATSLVSVTGCNPSCTFAQPQRVGTWNGLDVQVRQYGTRIVLVTAVVGSATDKHYPRGDNFWTDQTAFAKDAGAETYRNCLNGGNTSFGGLSAPPNLPTPAGYMTGTEADGAFFFQRIQTTTNPTDGSYQGHLDFINCNSSGGWVWNSSYPNLPIVVEVREGNTVLGTVTAANFRQDLVDAGKGNGQHGFTWPIPPMLKTNQPRTVTYRVQGQAYNLIGSPVTITCPTGSRLGVAESSGERPGKLVVSPNPSDGRIRIRFGATVGQTYQLDLTDLTGRHLANWTIQATNALVEVAVDVPQQTNGLVLVRLTDDEHTESTRVLISR